MAELRSRKWQITINNPIDKGYTHAHIREQLKLFKGLLYWCLSDEIGESGTPHTHIYIALKSGAYFSTIKNRFEGGHFEVANGTSQENRDYIFKEGKWIEDKKGETNLRNTHEEEGTMPNERQGVRSDIIALYEMIEEGYNNYEILRENPTYMFCTDKIDRTRQILLDEKYKNEFRKMDVTYVYGATGTGKTRTIMEQYKYTNVYRVTDYLHPWDGYKGQEVVMFEEFRSGLKIQEMLNYLDGYPLELPCRYSNKVACYTTVYIVTNIPLEAQYTNLQVESMETWKAFLRRINKVLVYTAHGQKIETDTQTYIDYGTGALPEQGVF